MRKYEQLAKQIIQNVGGEANVNGLIHCVTRLRFTLVNEAVAKDDVLKNTDGIISILKSGGQYQVVIGNHVAEVYAEVCEQLHITSDTVVTQTVKMGIGARILDIVSNVFTPILPVLCASGMIKGLNVLLAYLGVYGNDSSFYVLFNGMGDTLFFFFPMFLGYTSAKKFGLKPMVGMAIGAMLCYPKLNGAPMNFFDFDLTVTYTSTVLPVIVLCALAAPLERVFDKKLPSAVKSFLSPLFVFMIIVPLGYTLIGPTVNQIAIGISSLLSGLYNINPVIAGFIIAGLWSVLVLFGVHGPFMMVLIMNIMNGTPDGVYAVISAQSFAITGTMIGIWLKSKDPKLKSVSLGSWITGIFGVTEPAIYGILLPRIKFFVISCIGAGIGGAYLAFMNVKAYQMAGMGVFRIPAFMEPGNIEYSMTHVIIGYAIAVIVSFIATYLLFKDEANKEEAVYIHSPITGSLLPLEAIKDEVFSTKAMGEGIAITPSQGIVYAPFDGVVMTLFPTLHAIGFVSNEGCEVLVHIGLDTVNLQGQYFEAFVKQGDTVVKGQQVLSFDIDKLKDAGYVIDTPVIITNAAYKTTFMKQIGNVTNQDCILSCQK